MNKFLRLFGLQKSSKEKSLKQIEQEQCEHEWVNLGYMVGSGGYDSIYCPKCNEQKIVTCDNSEKMVKASELRKQYLESIHFDALDQRIKQIEMEMKKNGNG